MNRWGNMNCSQMVGLAGFAKSLAVHRLPAFHACSQASVHWASDLSPKPLSLLHQSTRLSTTSTRLPVVIGSQIKSRNSFMSTPGKQWPEHVLAALHAQIQCLIAFPFGPEYSTFVMYASVALAAERRHWKHCPMGEHENNTIPCVRMVRPTRSKKSAEGSKVV